MEHVRSHGGCRTPSSGTSPSPWWPWSPRCCYVTFSPVARGRGCSGDNGVTGGDVLCREPGCSGQPRVHKGGQRRDAGCWAAQGGEGRRDPRWDPQLVP